MNSLTQVAPVTVSNVPAKTEYWCGYDMYLEAYFANDPLTAEELAAMSAGERRGFEAAARHQSDAETDDYLMRYNVNAYGDYSQGGGF